MRRQGYEIIPVNPNISQWEDLPAYPNLLAIPGSVEIVDIFRRSEFVPPIIEQAIQIGAKVVWMQLGVIHEAAAALALRAGLMVVMDRCLSVEQRRYGNIA